MRLRIAALAAAATATAMASPGVASAQRFSFTAAGMALGTRNALALLGYEEVVSGNWVGGMAELKLGPVVLGASGTRGNLQAEQLGTALEREAGEVRGILRLQPVPVVGLEGGYIVRAYTSAAGRQEWRIPSGGVRLGGALGHRALQAFVRGHYVPPALVKLPAGQQSGDARWRFGLMAEAGLTVSPNRVPTALGFSYRFERYDFPGGAAAGRVEQFEALAVWLGIRVGR